jgi:diguanylate cyclase (GGDEF)-like protein
VVDRSFLKGLPHLIAHNVFKEEHKLAEDLQPQDVTGLLDPLTGLSNRFGLETFLELMEKKGVTGPLSVVTVELARFGSVNDSTGAEIGNKIISTVAKRLKKIFTNVALIARTHGDHFCLVLNGDEDLNEQIEMLNDFTQRPLAIRGEIIVLSIRVGVAVLGPAVASLQQRHERDPSAMTFKRRGSLSTR